MLSFHNDPAIKQKYLDRIIHHREMDNLIQGIGWENGKGCAVGCTLESYDHSRYPIELGLPEWLAYLEDRIFEGLPKELAQTWPERFLNAIPIGKDLEPVRHLLAIYRLNGLIEIQKNSISENPDIVIVLNQVIDSIRVVISCHEAELMKDSCDWSAAASAARAAAESAASAAWSAAWSAAASAARSAASAARSAESAAESAAWSAASAASAARSAWSAARSAWIKESENLLRLLENFDHE